MVAVILHSFIINQILAVEESGCNAEDLTRYKKT